ncbi:MAG TPA: DnaB-like helicase C-terminal domain-containing protein [Ignavibacteria bacterium]
MQNINFYTSGNIKNTKLTPIDIDVLIDTMRADLNLKSKIDKLRNGLSSEQKALIKNSLPYFCTSIFTDNIRRKENFIKTLFLSFDIDKIDELSVIRETLICDDHCYMLYVSPSGNGIRFICKLENEISTNSDYECIYKYYKNHFENLYSLQFDHTIDSSRAWYYSYDKNIFYNPECVPLPLIIKDEIKENIEIKESEGYFRPVNEGGRDKHLISYSGLLYSQGLKGDLLKNLLSDYNLKYNNPPLTETEVKKIFNSVSKYSTQQTKKEPSTIKELFQILHKILTQKDDKRIQLGINEFDIAMQGGMLGGEVLGIVGATGNFKSTLAMNSLLRHCLKKPVIYVSLEMPAYLIAMRIIMILSGLDYSTIRTNIKNGDAGFKSRLKQIETDYLNKILIINRRIHINEFPLIIKQGREFFKQEISLLCVDHCGLVQSSFKAEYDRMSDIADTLIYNSIEYDVPIISIYQSPREDLRADKLTLHSFKGSGNIENSLRYAIVLNSVNDNNFKNYDYMFNGNIVKLDEDLYKGIIRNDFSIVSSSLEKNSTGAYGKKELLLFNRRNLRMTTLTDYLKNNNFNIQ